MESLDARRIEGARKQRVHSHGQMCGEMWEAESEHVNLICATARGFPSLSE